MRQIFSLCLFVLLAAPALAQTPADPSIEARVDQIMEPFSGTETPGAVVAFVRGGETVFSKAYGMADLTHGIPFTLGTRSNIGSTSKQFTGYAISLLESEGVFSLDDDVRTYIRELPDFGETVTLQHFATHTSGYREFFDVFMMAGRQPGQDRIGRGEVVEVVQRQPELQNASGAEWNYNNTGYSLLALVVERVTERRFDEWMAERVFMPAGMPHTLVRMHPAQIVPKSARGYHPSGTGFVEAGDVGAAPGTGAIYATVEDLASWMRKLRAAEGRDADLIRQMTTPFVLTSGDTTGYGLGLRIDQWQGLRRIQHGGSDIAHRSSFAYYPDIDAGIIVLSNNSSFTGWNELDEVFLEEHIAPAESAPDVTAATVFDPDRFDPILFDAYAGRYRVNISFQGPRVLTFRRDGGEYYMQLVGQPEMPILPTSDSTFAIVDTDARVVFHRDADGRVDALTLYASGTHRGTRLEDEAPRIDFEVLAGRYFSEELETFYTLVVEEERLIVRHRQAPDATLEPEGIDTFIGGPPLTSITFQRDDDGQVIGFRGSLGNARGIWFDRIRGVERAD